MVEFRARKISVKFYQSWPMGFGKKGLFLFFNVDDTSSDRNSPPLASLDHGFRTSVALDFHFIFWVWSLNTILTNVTYKTLKIIANTVAFPTGIAWENLSNGRKSVSCGFIKCSADWLIETTDNYYVDLTVETFELHVPIYLNFLDS